MNGHKKMVLRGSIKYGKLLELLTDKCLKYTDVLVPTVSQEETVERKVPEDYQETQGTSN